MSLPAPTHASPHANELAMAKGITRQDTVSRDKLAYQWNFLGLLWTRSCHDTWRFRDSSVCFSEHFDFFDPARRATGLTRQDTVPWAKLAYAWNFLGLLCTRSFHDTWSLYDASVCFSEHFDFFDPARRATGFTRRDTVHRANLAHAWNFHGLLCPCSCLGTWRCPDASVCFSEHFDFFDPRTPCHGLNAVPWAKLANA
jgi:hypothetical protein